MHRCSVTIRISCTLASITLCVLLAALALGLYPDRIGAIADGRAALCESLAVSCSLAAQQNDRKTMEANLQAVTRRNPSLISAGLRRTSGDLYVAIGDHPKQWPDRTSRSTLTHMQVPIFVNRSRWGTLELRFSSPVERSGIMLPLSTVRLILFVSAVSLILHFFYLWKVLAYLDPSQVIPERVRATLDSLAEGILVLDREQRIVLANQSFAKAAGQQADELQGHKVSQLPWHGTDPQDPAPARPWERSIRDGVMATGEVVKLGQDEAARRTFQVNSAPIRSETGENRGALASFSDITALEVRNVQLSKTLSRLRQSRDLITEQNERLRVLAAIDPLTQCMNRRAFFEELELQLEKAERTGFPLSYLILDVDHFKAVNDNHGHMRGDEVLVRIGQLLQQNGSDSRVVCRYGGEEFSVLLPNLDIEGAAELAETLRSRIESTTMADLRITASCGVVQFDTDSPEPLQALDQADKALYFAKRTGRNRVMRWDQLPTSTKFRGASRKPEPRVPSRPKTHIPFTAVSILLSALEHRDPATAEHCRRVSNICVAIATGILSEEQKYVLEIAALLHDIGKLSVPDAVLRKPGPLTPDEWKVMDTHLRMGLKTVTHSFGSFELGEILKTYRAAFDGRCHDSELPSGDDIPVSARILKIADAYDAMVARHAYRDEMSEDEAFTELRRCAGTQFDPELVERCINIVLSRDVGKAIAVDGITREAALNVGMQLERLLCALDGEDVTSLKAIVDKTRAIAENNNIVAISDAADALLQRIAEDDEPCVEVLQLSLDLADLCRRATNAYTIASMPS